MGQEPQECYCRARQQEGTISSIEPLESRTLLASLQLLQNNMALSESGDVSDLVDTADNNGIDFQADLNGDSVSGYVYDESNVTWGGSLVYQIVPSQNESVGEPVTIHATVGQNWMGTNGDSYNYNFSIEGGGSNLHIGDTVTFDASFYVNTPYAASEEWSGEGFTWWQGGWDVTWNVDAIPGQASTTTALSASPNPSVYGQPVTFTATVASGTGSGTPTGSVTFMDGTTTLNPGGTQLNSSGVASFTTSALAVGDHPAITAVYSGYSNFGGSTSPAIDELVGQPVLPISPTWNSNGSLDYGYTIIAAGLPQATTVDLDWASGTTLSTVIGSPIVTTSTQTAQGSYPLNATPAQLGTPPAGTTNLLVVVDPSNLITPADPSKVAALALLPDLAVTTPTWEPDGSLDFSYSISYSSLPQASTAAFYWAPTASFDELNDTLAYSTATQTAPGTYPIHVSSSEFLCDPPDGDKYLLAVVNPDGSIDESDSANDTNDVASCSIGDITANSVQLASDGGVDYTYQIIGYGLPQATTVELAWASGTTADTIVDNPIITTPTETDPDTYTLHATAAQLGEPPSDAEYLLEVVNPDNVISPDDPRKVMYLELDSIAVTSVSWNQGSDGVGVQFTYAISPGGLSEATKVAHLLVG